MREKLFSSMPLATASIGGVWGWLGWTTDTGRRRRRRRRSIKPTCWQELVFIARTESKGWSHDFTTRHLRFSLTLGRRQLAADENVATISLKKVFWKDTFFFLADPIWILCPIASSKWNPRKRVTCNFYLNVSRLKIETSLRCHILSLFVTRLNPKN
jgi:hypothetical protein